jgi:hypothetical protein
MLFDVTIYYLLAVGSDLPGLRLASLVSGIVKTSSDRHGIGFQYCPWFVCAGGKVATVQGFNSCN